MIRHDAQRSEEEILDRYEDLLQTPEPVPAEVRAEIARLHPRVSRIREDRRLAQIREERALAQAQAEAERLAIVPSPPWLPPVAWIRDGSYSKLSSRAQRVLLPIYALLRDDGKAARVRRDQLSRLTGLGVWSISHAIGELEREGWIRVKRHRRPGRNRTLVWAWHPKPGERRIKKKKAKVAP